MPGGSTTDFGAPEIAPAYDSQPLGPPELERYAALLQACWQALDRARLAAAGRELRKGPRRGGRDLEGVVRHVTGAEHAYLNRLGWKEKKSEFNDLDDELAQTRQATLDGLAAAARGDLPAQGPRGGKIWPPRYFVRRAAWHMLDHVWEIEDRIL